MKSLPTQSRAIQKRIALLKAAVAEFAEAGFEQATAKSIASRAGVATGTFYQYFDNKNDILRVIAENRYAELDKHISILESNEVSVSDPAIDNERASTFDAPAAMLFKRVLSFLYDFHCDDAALHQVLDQRRASDSELNSIIERGEDVIRAHVVDFVSPYQADDESAEIVAASLFAMGEGLVHRMVFHSRPDNPDQMLDVGAQMLASYFTRS